MNQETDCSIDHSRLVTFNLQKAKTMNPAEIRKEFPRVKCQECQTMVYASQDHLMAGDW